MKDFKINVLSMLLGTGLIVSPTSVLAEGLSQPLDLSGHWVGYLCIGLFAVAYVFVVLEEVLELPKSKPMMLATLIWAAIALVYKDQGPSSVAATRIRHDD